MHNIQLFMDRPPSHRKAVLMLAAIAVIAAFVIPQLGTEATRATPEPGPNNKPTTSQSATTSTVPGLAMIEPSADDDPPEPTVDASCATGTPHQPTGNLVVVPGATTPSSDGPIKTYIVEVEAGLGIDAACFADRVHQTLGDPRSWGGREGFAVQRVDVGEPSFRVTLASPATVDERCQPLVTAGIYSCWDAQRAMINVWRWETGSADYAGDLWAYQIYVINHEVGHGLKHGHVNCTGPGDLAPVMMQQTKGLDGCWQNGWPLDAEIDGPLQDEQPSDQPAGDVAPHPIS